MENKLTTNEKLDEILKYLNQANIDLFKKSKDEFDKNRQDLKTSQEILSELNLMQINIECSELNLMLFYLSKEEKYILEDVKYWEEGQKDNVPAFRILFTGKFFIENGGYNQRFINDKTNHLYKKVTNISLIFGGLSAGIYYLLEIVKFVYSYFHCG